jgi:hypothetical protein
MTTEATGTSSLHPATEEKVPVNLGPGAVEALKLYEREIAVYLRELPRLLKEGHKGRHALIKGDTVLSIWDTQGDAIQAGRDRFGLDPIYVKIIDPRDSERFGLLEAFKESQCRP